MITALTTLLFTGSPVDLEKLNKKLQNEHHIKTEYVFSESQKNYLDKNNKSSLSKSFSVKYDEHKIKLIQKIIQNQKLNINWEFDRPVTINSSYSKTGTNLRLNNRPTDPYIHEQWGYKNKGNAISSPISNQQSLVLNARANEDASVPENLISKKEVTVAVIDSGIFIEHPDLKDAIKRKASECEALKQYESCLTKENKRTCDEKWLKIDSDQNGYPLDCNGWSFLGPKNPISKQFGSPFVKDEFSHGTHVAGIIAAQKNNIGIRGISPFAKILPIQVIGEDPSQGNGSVIGDDSETGERATKLTQSVARGILYAIESKVDIINLSLGWNGRADSPLVRDLIKTAREKNILVVAAAGNDGTDALTFPCQYSDVICVGAHAPDGALTEFSNHGSSVDIAAPGIHILSTIPFQLSQDYFPLFTDEPGYDFKEGTSMAAPFVSAALATLLSQNIKPEDAFVKLLKGTRQRPLIEKRITLRGNLDINQALEQPLEPLFMPLNKGVLPVLWDGESKAIRIEIPIKNHGSNSRNINIFTTLSDRHKKHGNVLIKNSRIHFEHWSPQETKTISTVLNIKNKNISSDVALDLNLIDDTGKNQHISIILQIFTILEKLSPPKNAITIPITDGQWIGNPDEGQPTLLTIESLDSSEYQDYLAIIRGETEWQLQVVKETQHGYVLLKPKTIPAINGAIRAPKRIDLDFDGKSEYVLTYLIAPHETNETDSSQDQVPYFRFDWLDENLENVFESFTFKNKTTVINLDKYQWIKHGNRLVPLWVDYGKTPAEERSKNLNPWEPQINYDKRGVRFRVYYHDPLASDGVRSIKINNTQKPFTVLDQTKNQLKTGEVTVIAVNSNYYGSNYFALHFKNSLETPKIENLDFFPYRNFSSTEGMKNLFLKPNLSLGSNLSFFGASGLMSQRVSALLNMSGQWFTKELQIEHPSGTQFNYRVIGTYLDESFNLYAYTQADFDLLYKDERLQKTFSISLQRYTFLPSVIFDRSFIPVVAESQGVRLAAIQIPDGMGAYPGAEVIAPLLNERGETTDLIKPARLRIQLSDFDCDWLKSMPASSSQPSQAVYFCGDRFIRVPYRF